MPEIALDFRQPSGHYEPLLPFLTGGGQLVQTPTGLRLSMPPLPPKLYADAQLDDFQGRQRRDFLWQPPLHLSITARFSHSAAEMQGTFGFGFWNNPITMTGAGLLAAPQTLWFFGAAPPNDLHFVAAVPGHGWKAASLHTRPWPGWFLAGGLAGMGLLGWLPGVGRRLMALGRRFIRAAEAPLTIDPTTWHQYEIDWQPTQAEFRVDGQTVLQVASPPHGPLALVIWVDNQYAILNNNGQLGYGLLPNDNERWLELAELTLTRTR